MQVVKTQAVEMFKALGFVTAPAWVKGDGDKMKTKLAGLVDMVAAGEVDPDAPKQPKGFDRELFDSIVTAVTDGDGIELVDSAEGEEDAKPVKKGKGKPVGEPIAAKPVKKGKASKDAKPAKEKKAPKKPKGPGVIASIVTILQAATAAKPVTKEVIHEKLVKLFPDRDSESMKTTVGIQVPSRLNKEKDLGIARNDNGYYIGTKAAKAAPAKAKAKK